MTTLLKIALEFLAKDDNLVRGATTLLQKIRSKGDKKDRWAARIIEIVQDSQERQDFLKEVLAKVQEDPAVLTNYMMAVIWILKEAQQDNKKLLNLASEMSDEVIVGKTTP